MVYAIEKFESLRYIIRYPAGYTEAKKYPVLIGLHGAGSRGEDIEVLRANPFFVVTETLEDFPFISVAPQCHENTWFDLFETLKRFTMHIAAAPYTDARRLYLMGASMGGYATWQLAMSMPAYFAAAVPICGGGMYWNAGRLVGTPVWAFHGSDDPTVLVEESGKMVDGINRRGGNAKLTVYDGAGHDAWSATYSNPEVFHWLLSHENRNVLPLQDEYQNSKLYG